jgi:V8-like Glu-specific endopeptidase
MTTTEWTAGLIRSPFRTDQGGIGLGASRLVDGIVEPEHKLPASAEDTAAGQLAGPSYEEPELLEESQLVDPELEELKLEESELGPESDQEVIGHDDRVRIRNTLQVPFRWVCSLDITRGSDFYRGSGLLIGPRQVLTAAHNIYDWRGNPPDAAYAVPARDGSDQPFGRFKAVAYTSSSAYLQQPVPGTRFDFALVTLETDASDVRAKALRGMPLGHWGSVTNGHATDLGPVDRDFVAGRLITICGYPGDKCDGEACDPARGWSKASQANTMWSHFSPASLPEEPGQIMYTADTYKGQSGSPVWIKFTNGRRALVGVHVNWQRVTHAATGHLISGNIGVHLDKDVVALIQSWMPGSRRSPQ